MALTAAGFDGPLAEGDLAVIVAAGGQPYGAPESPGDLKVTTVTGQVLTVAVAAGNVTGWGVRVKSTTSLTLALGSIASGTRWDLVYLRRDWTTNTVTIGSRPGTATKAYPAARNVTPGTVDDQPLALVQVTAGQSLPTAVVDLRVFPSKVFSVDDLLAAPTDLGTDVVLPTGARFHRSNNTSGVPTWLPVKVVSAMLVAPW